MKTIKAKVEVEIYDDPEFCGSLIGSCEHYTDEWDNDDKYYFYCRVRAFKDNNILEIDKEKDLLKKCDQCKAAYQKTNNQESNTSKAMRLLGLLAHNQHVERFGSEPSVETVGDQSSIEVITKFLDEL